MKEVENICLRQLGSVQIIFVYSNLKTENEG